MPKQKGGVRITVVFIITETAPLVLYSSKWSTASHENYEKCRISGCPY